MESNVSLLLLVICSLNMVEAQLKLYNMQASNLPTDIFSSPDGYVDVYCGSVSLGETAIRYDDPNPWWEEEFTYFQAQENDVLKLKVYDSDVLFDDLLGVCERPLKVGTYKHDCYLDQGGTLQYTYTLG